MRSFTDYFGVVKFSNKSDSGILTKVRLWLYICTLLHLTFVSLIVLTIDFRKADDPRVWVYQDIRFKLITCWFNLLNFVYIPTSIYCEWRHLNSQGDLQHVKILNQIRCTCFSSILLPTTAFADILFWRLWNQDRELIAPASVDSVAPFWTQHSMHTVSLVFVILDLVLSPRKKPDNTAVGLSVMCVFIGAYIIVVIHALSQGQYLYPVLKELSVIKLYVLVLYIFLDHYFYYTLQWCISDFIWSNSDSSKIKRNSVSSYVTRKFLRW